MPQPDEITTQPTRTLVVHREPDMQWLDRPRDELRATLRTSLYPGARPESIDAVIAYCEAAGLNVMLKPVHIVPMSVKKPGTNQYEMRDVVMPGIGHYRTQASRTGTYFGKSAPEYGPMVERSWGQFKMHVPEWCRITVRRLVAGQVAEFTAEEFWDENYASKKRDDPCPNAMWQKRPHGQLSKCTEAQALRMAFPELVGTETAEEMEGKTIDLNPEDVTVVPRAAKSLDSFAGVKADAEPEPEPEEAETVEVEEAEITEMPADAKTAWAEKQDWALGWKWLNEVMPGLNMEDRQSLATEYAALLWAVYNSDLKAKKGGGPQSKAALAFIEQMGVTVPETETADG